MNGSNTEADAIPLAIEHRMKWLVNNQRFADVKFVVGAEKQLVYAHKNIIASGSPVFEKMFFANHSLQMTGCEPVEIPDLTSTGFVNMLKYIYTNGLEGLDLSELFETFMAGDKYHVYNMSDKIFSFIKSVLDTFNCCIIYDQLMKFPTEYRSVPLDQVKTIIRCNSPSVFNGMQFVNISQETLVDLLNMDALTIKEIDVLRSCAKWVTEEIKRQNLESNATNKQMVFKPIKNFIRFSKITFDELRHFNQITDLLSSDELSSLFLHLLNVSKFTVECKTARKKLELSSASCTCKRFSSSYNTQQNFSEFSPVLKASGSIFFITNVYTFLPTNVEDLEFLIHDNMGLNVELNAEMNYEKLHSDNCWHFRFIDPVKIESTKDYKFVFKFRSIMISCNKLSRDTEMIVDDNSFDINLTLSSKYHCLKKIDFYLIS